MTRRTPLGTKANVRPRASRGRTPGEETPLAIIAPDVEVDDAFRAHIHQRAGFRLGKLAHRIDRVTVRFHRISGPTGAPAVRCRIKLMLPALDAVVVEAVQRNARDAFDRAMNVADRTAQRSMGRHRTLGRRPARRG